MITAIFSAIAALPKLLGLLKDLIGWISARIEVAEKNQVEKDLAKALEKAKQTKDTSDLDNIFKGR